MLRVRFPIVLLKFSIDIILPAALWPRESTRPLTEMSTRNVSWGGKRGRCVGLKTLPPSCAECLEICEPQPPGTVRACPGLYRDCFTFICLGLLGSPHFYVLYIQPKKKGGGALRWECFRVQRKLSTSCRITILTATRVASQPID